jgi:hypothetical protein
MPRERFTLPQTARFRGVKEQAQKNPSYPLNFECVTRVYQIKSETMD